MLATIRELFGQRNATSLEKYRTLVASIADGKAIPSTAADVAIGAGRSLGDLENDVLVLSNRRQAAADLVKAEALASEVERLGKAYVEAGQERDALEKRHRDEMAAAVGKMQQADGERRSATLQREDLKRRAMSVLTSTADPAIGQQISALEHERQRLREERGTSMQRSPFGQPPSWDRVTTEAKRAEHERETAAWLKSINQRETAIAQQIERLHAKRLDPEACVIG